ncbi:tautomerase family protein [Arthrobacter bambusae]
MPLVRIDLIEHRTPEQVREVADAVHEAIVDVLGIPERDRFQILTSHASAEVIALDAGLGFERSHQLVMIHIFTQEGRSPEVKQQLFALLAEKLGGQGVPAADVFVGITENSPADWSFGFGRAQYLTGELSVPSS